MTRNFIQLLYPWLSNKVGEGGREGEEEGGKVFVKPGLKMGRNPAAIGRRRFEGDAVSPSSFPPPPLLHLSFPSPPVGPASSWKPVFREQRNFFSVRNYYREFHGRMFVSRISFPLHRPVGHSTRVHSYSSVFQLLSESSFSSSSSSSSLSLSLSFSSAIHHFVSEFIVLRRGELPVRLNGRNYILENLLHFIES